MQILLQWSTKLREVAYRLSPANSPALSSSTSKAKLMAKITYSSCNFGEVEQVHDSDPTDFAATSYEADKSCM